MSEEGNRIHQLATDKLTAIGITASLLKLLMEMQIIAAQFYSALPKIASGKAPLVVLSNKCGYNVLICVFFLDLAGLALALFPVFVLS